MAELERDSSSNENNSNNNNNKNGNNVWNKVRGDDNVNVMIGNEESWPALSESTKKNRGFSRSADRRLVVGSSSSQGHLISNPQKNSRNQNHSKTNQNHRSNTNQTSMAARHRPKHGPSQNGINHHPRPLPLARPPPLPAALATPPLPPPLPPYPIYEGFCPLPPPVPYFPPPPFNGNNWERPPMNSDQSFQRNPNPRGNYVGRPRGDGAASSGHARRDNYRDRNKGFARPVRSQVPPPPTFLPMPPVRPFPDHMGYDMANPYMNFPPPPPEFYMRFPPPMPPPFMNFPPVDPALPSKLIKQIDHYFSDDNLAKDSFLRSRMDDEGWVDIAFIAAFPKVQQMTQNLELIQDSLKDSTIVEVQGNRIRRRNDWRKWVMSIPRSSNGGGSPTLPVSAEDKLSNYLETVKLEEEINSINVVPCDGNAVSSADVAQSDVVN